MPIASHFSWISGSIAAPPLAMKSSWPPSVTTRAGTACAAPLGSGVAIFRSRWSVFIRPCAVASRSMPFMNSVSTWGTPMMNVGFHSCIVRASAAGWRLVG